MRRIRLSSVNDFAEWRAAARALLLAGVRPRDVEWIDPAQPADLLAELDPPTAAQVGERKVGRVPARFLRQSQLAICHADPDRFGLLYSLLWRVQKDRRVLFNLDDTDVGKLNRRVEAVAAECARMIRELRFRRAVDAGGVKGLVASFVPRHYVLESVAAHFAREMHEPWVITTPYRTALWDGRSLTFVAGAGSLGDESERDPHPARVR